MQLIVTTVLAGSAFVVGVWFWRSRVRRPGERPRSHEPSRSTGEIERPAHPPVPNIRIEPHPDDLPVAVLDFEGARGAVPLMRGETVIGRHSEDDVRIRDVRVSRHHALLTAGPGHFEIRNLTAGRPEPNPMFVNGTRREHAVVVDGDMIALGGVSFTFRQARHGPGAPAKRDVR